MLSERAFVESVWGMKGFNSVTGWAERGSREKVGEGEDKEEEEKTSQDEEERSHPTKLKKLQEINN